MLRTMLTAALAVVAAATAVPADAAGPRVAKATYKTPGGVTGVLSGDGDLNGDRYGSANVFTRKGESRIAVEVVDDAGLPVAFELGQDTGDERPVKLGTFCGKTSEPVKLAVQRLPVEVYILAGECGAGVSAPTTGTVVATLS